jgi:putative DNA primase/helicase
MDWQEHGLAEPADVAAATREYRDEQDLVAGFIEDRCIVDEGQQAATDHLYESFLGYCKSIGKPPDGKTGFGSRLRERGFAPVRIATQRSWKGVGLRPAPLATVEGNHGRLVDDTL